MRPAQILATAFALASVSAAFSQPEVEGVEYKGVGDFILMGRRQDQNNQNNGDNTNNKNNGDQNNNDNNDSNNGPDNKNNNNPDKTNNPDNKDGDKNGNDSGDKTNDGNKDSGKDNGKDGKDGKDGDKSDESKPSSTVYHNIQPGRVSLTSPAITGGSTLFPIGSYVTFGWNYTDLKATPKQVDVLASCSSNSHMYTIAAKIPGDSKEAVWDTKQYENNGDLPMASYTLFIKDSSVGITAQASPGYLQNFNQFYFAMYSTQPYTPFSDWNCATCDVNGGIANVPAHHTLGMIVGMFTLTLLSFTWFATNRFGIF